ncbi:MAG TPA: hypothetical protein VHA74_00915 [Candidatus Dojkabacteria bacterium]|nr:hypothetical protein [Candidatus Dojkabacteria bacterium]
MENAITDLKTALKQPVTIFVIVGRFLGYVFILYRPLEGILFSILFDILDFEILSIGNIHWKLYNKIEKPVDYFQYIFMLVPAYYTPVFLPYVILLGIRTMGMGAYYIFNSDRVFIIFPNMAEYFLLFYFIFQRLNINISVVSWQFLAILYIFKLAQEYIMHQKDSNDMGIKLYDFDRKIREKFFTKKVI